MRSTSSADRSDLEAMGSAKKVGTMIKSWLMLREEHNCLVLIAAYADLAKLVQITCSLVCKVMSLFGTVGITRNRMSTVCLHQAISSPSSFWQPALQGAADSVPLVHAPTQRTHTPKSLAKTQHPLSLFRNMMFSVTVLGCGHLEIGS